MKTQCVQRPGEPGNVGEFQENNGSQRISFFRILSCGPSISHNW